jgi:Fe-S cluster assembly iron-binding protein IscA
MYAKIVQIHIDKYDLTEITKILIDYNDEGEKQSFFIT